MNRRFIKKPLEIEAFLLGTDTRPEWAEQDDIKYYIGFAIIKTLEGEMRAEEGDYIIKGIKGEIYPCKPEIFEASYDEVNQPYIAKLDPLFDATGFRTPSVLIPISDDMYCNKCEKHFEVKRGLEMIISECPACKKDSLLFIDNKSSCTNDDCEKREWGICLKEHITDYLLEKLHFCGCGTFDHCFPFIHKFLLLIQQKRESNNYDDSMKKIQGLIIDEWENVAWVLCHILDNQKILTHAGCVINGWIDDDNFFSILSRYCSEYVKKVIE